MPREPKFGDLIVLNKNTMHPGERAVIVFVGGPFVDAVMENAMKVHSPMFIYRALRDQYDFEDEVKQSIAATGDMQERLKNHIGHASASTFHLRRTIHAFLKNSGVEDFQVFVNIDISPAPAFLWEVFTESGDKWNGRVLQGSD